MRKSGFTIAPEAGTQRLRDVINKNLDEEQILDGLPAGLRGRLGADQALLHDRAAHRDRRRRGRHGRSGPRDPGRSGAGSRGKSRRPQVTLSASSFIPKPETPFQWVGMDRIENLYRKQDRIAARVRRGVRFKHHHCETSFLEGVFSRGDRALGDVLERAWRNGARFDGWDEHLDRRAWTEAFRAEGVDPEFYAYRDLDPERPLPWHVVHSRVNRKWLALELRRAMQAGTLSVCGPTDCHGCAPFARECVKGIVAETTDRQLASDVAAAVHAVRARARRAGRPRARTAAAGRVDASRSRCAREARPRRAAGLPLPRPLQQVRIAALHRTPRPDAPASPESAPGRPRAGLLAEVSTPSRRSASAPRWPSASRRSPSTSTSTRTGGWTATSSSRRSTRLCPLGCVSIWYGRSRAAPPRSETRFALRATGSPPRDARDPGRNRGGVSRTTADRDPARQEERKDAELRSGGRTAGSRTDGRRDTSA